MPTQALYHLEKDPRLSKLERTNIKYRLPKHERWNLYLTQEEYSEKLKEAVDKALKQRSNFETMYEKSGEKVDKNTYIARKIAVSVSSDMCEYLENGKINHFLSANEATLEELLSAQNLVSLQKLENLVKHQIETANKYISQYDTKAYIAANPDVVRDIEANKTKIGKLNLLLEKVQAKIRLMPAQKQPEKLGTGFWSKLGGLFHGLLNGLRAIKNAILGILGRQKTTHQTNADNPNPMQAAAAVSSTPIELSTHKTQTHAFDMRQSPLSDSQQQAQPEVSRNPAHTKKLSG